MRQLGGWPHHTGPPCTHDSKRETLHGGKDWVATLAELPRCTQYNGHVMLDLSDQ